MTAPDPTGFGFDRADTVFPAAAPALPMTVEESELPPFALADDPCFPYGIDPALVDGHVDITPENCGLGEDRIARVLWLSGLLGQAVAALSPAERAELEREYAWPTRIERASQAGRRAA